MLSAHQHLHIVPHRYYPTCRAAMHDLRVQLARYPSIRFGVVKDFDGQELKWLLYRVHEQKQGQHPPFQTCSD